MLENSLRVDDIRIHDEFNQVTSHTPGSRRIVSKYETVPGRPSETRAWMKPRMQCPDGCACHRKTIPAQHRPDECKLLSMRTPRNSMFNICVMLARWSDLEFLTHITVQIPHTLSLENDNRLVEVLFGELCRPSLESWSLRNTPKTGLRACKKKSNPMENSDKSV